MLEHKGVNNRVLRELGWIEVHGNRDSPRNSDSKLRSEEELHKMHIELMSLRKNADGFIQRIFRSTDRIWIDRCSSIIKNV